MWSGNDRDVVFNVYLSPLTRMADRVVGYLRPAFGPTPPAVIAGLVIVFILALRALAAPRGGHWEVSLGFESATAGQGIVSAAAFSVLSYAAFLFKVWCVSLLYARAHGASGFSHAHGVLHHLARPFSGIRIDLRPLVLFVAGVVIAFTLNFFGGWPDNPAPSVALKLGISSLAGFVNAVEVVLSLLMLLIIGSWVSVFTGSRAIMSFCRDWIDLLMGPMRRYPVRIGMLDLSPLIFFFAVQFVVNLARLILVGSYRALP
jgi:uncharacterized protein YggT (Ycf19 family)